MRTAVTVYAALCLTATCVAVLVLRAAKARNAAERAFDATDPDAPGSPAALLPIPAQRGADT